MQAGEDGLTALADAGVEDFGEHFVVAGLGDRVIIDQLYRSSKRAYESDGLLFWDLDRG